MFKIMQLVPLLCLLPTASAFGTAPETTLYLNEGVGWCESDLDETPCSFDCDASYEMEDYDIAVMCYDACVEDYPDETIENVEYYQGGCYCQTSCPSMECDSNTATLSEDYYLPACDDDTDDDWGDTGCVATCGFDDDLSNFEEVLCDNYSWCATTCNDDYFASYDEIEYYCTYGGDDDGSCDCDNRRRLDASTDFNAHKTKRTPKRVMKSIKRVNQKKTKKGRA